MAINSTIFKVDLRIADIDSNYYQDHNLTIARHPSENDERMMVRILAFLLNSQDGLVFGKGLSVDDEPDLWVKSIIDEIELWIDVGQISDKRLRKACNRSEIVKIYTYGGNDTDVWWQQNNGKLNQINNLQVYRVPADDVILLAGLVQRTMRLQCTIQDGGLMLTNGEQTVEPVIQVLKD